MASKQPEQGNTSAGSPAPQQRPQPPPQPKPQGTVNLLTNFLAACARNIAATATGALGPVSSPSSSPIGDGARPSPSTPLPPGEGVRVTAHPSPAAGPRRNSPLGTQPSHATRALPDSVAHDDVSRPPAGQPAGSSTGHHPSAMVAAGSRKETGGSNISSGNDELDEVVSATVPGEDGGAGGRSGSNNNNGLTLNFADDDPYQTCRSSHGDDAWQGVQGTCQACSSDEAEGAYIRVGLEGCQKCRPIWTSGDEEYVMDVPGLREQLDATMVDGDLRERRAAAALGQGGRRGALGEVGGGGEAGGVGGGEAEAGEEERGEDEGEGGGGGGGGGAGRGEGKQERGGRESKAAQRATEAKNLEAQMLAAEEGLVEAMAHRALTEIRARRRGGPAYRRIIAGAGEDPEWETMWAAKTVAREELNALRKEVDVADFARRGKEWRSGRMRRIWMAAVEAVDREVPSLPCWEESGDLGPKNEKGAAALSPSSRPAAKKRTVSFAGELDEGVRRSPWQPTAEATAMVEAAPGAAVPPAVEPEGAGCVDLSQPLFKSRAWAKARNEAVTALVERRGLSGREKVAIMRQIQLTLEFLTTPLGMGLGEKSPVGGRPTPSSVCWRYAKTLAGQRRHQKKHHKKPQRPRRETTPQAGWEPRMIRLETQKINHEIVACRDQDELEREVLRLDAIEKGRLTQAKWEGAVREHEAGRAQTREARLASLASTPLHPIPPSLISERLQIPQEPQPQRVQQQQLGQQLQCVQQVLQEQGVQKLQQEQQELKQLLQPQLAMWSPFQKVPTEPGPCRWPTMPIFPSSATVGEQQNSEPGVVELSTAMANVGAAASPGPVAPPPAPKPKAIHDNGLLASKGPAAAAVFRKWQAKKSETSAAAHARQVRDLQQAQAAGLAQAEAAAAAAAKAKAPVSRAQRRATERALDKERTKADKAPQLPAADQLLENALKQPAVKKEKDAPTAVTVKPTGLPLSSTQASAAKAPAKAPAKVPVKAAAGRAVNALAPTSKPAVAATAAATTAPAATAAKTTTGPTSTATVRKPRKPYVGMSTMSIISEASRALSPAAAATAAVAGLSAAVPTYGPFGTSPAAGKSFASGTSTAGASTAAAAAAAPASVHSTTERNCPPPPHSQDGEWLWPAMVFGCAKLTGTHARGTTGRFPDSATVAAIGEAKGNARKPSAVGAGGAGVGRANRAPDPGKLNAPNDQIGWIGCASPVPLSLPLSNWKRMRDPEAWQKVVGVAIVRYPRPTVQNGETP